MLQQYLTELQKINLLEREEELDLWRACADGDQSAYRKIITAYQPLVFKIAMTFRLTETQTLELIQEGTVGLLERLKNLIIHAVLLSAFLLPTVSEEECLIFCRLNMAARCCLWME